MFRALLRPFALGLIGLIGLAGGCLFDAFESGDDGLADNARCEDGEQCRSGGCSHGFCTPGSCGPDGGSCNEGWTCRTITYTTGLIFKRTETRHVCAVRCDSGCPENYGCGGEYCELDPLLVDPFVELEVPPRAAIGETIVLRATVTSPIDEAIDRVTWLFPDGTRVDGEEIEAVMHEADLVSGTLQVVATAYDVTGREGEAVASIAACEPAGAACSNAGACCSQSCDAGTCAPSP